MHDTRLSNWVNNGNVMTRMYPIYLCERLFLFIFFQARFFVEADSVTLACKGNCSLGAVDSSGVVLSQEITAVTRAGRFFLRSLFGENFLFHTTTDMT